MGLFELCINLLEALVCGGAIVVVEALERLHEAAAPPDDEAAVITHNRLYLLVALSVVTVQKGHEFTRILTQQHLSAVGTGNKSTRIGHPSVTSEALKLTSVVIAHVVQLAVSNCELLFLKGQVHVCLRAGNNDSGLIEGVEGDLEGQLHGKSILRGSELEV